MVSLEISTMRLKKIYKQKKGVQVLTQKQDSRLRKKLDKSVDGEVESDLQWYTHLTSNI